MPGTFGSSLNFLSHLPFLLIILQMLFRLLSNFSLHSFTRKIVCLCTSLHEFTGTATSYIPTAAQRRQICFCNALFILYLTNMLSCAVVHFNKISNTRKVKKWGPGDSWWSIPCSCTSSIGGIEAVHNVHTLEMYPSFQNKSTKLFIYWIQRKENIIWSHCVKSFKNFVKKKQCEQLNHFLANHYDTSLTTERFVYIL